MKLTLQKLVATQFESAGFKRLGEEIRSANGVSDLRLVTARVIKKIAATDPEGFGQDIKNISNGVKSNG
ncbi:MAG: hypothetical protein HOI88_05570 [Phycisphaerae bacterium]|jgi:hypothetical protein|nr:hypothetical protein [Phycisphaerae bacterium]MBT6282341.1 hypothetical protein [Phycisphaerae bacterium]